MQGNSNAAYNFDLFLDSTAERKEKEVKLKVVKNKNYEKNKIDRQFKILNRLLIGFEVVVVLASIIGILLIKAQITEACSQINSTKAQLSELDSEYVYYKTFLLRSTSLTEIEEYAQSQGMMKIDSSQVTYIDLADENKIVKNPTRIEKFFTNINDFFIEVKTEYFN